MLTVRSVDGKPPGFDDVFVLHLPEARLPAGWRRLLRACRLGHLGEALDAAHDLEEPLARQIAADSMLLHARPDLAQNEYKGLLGAVAEQGGDQQETTLRAELGLAATYVADDEMNAAWMHAEAAMDACFALTVHDDTVATGHDLCEFGEYVGRFPLQTAARTLADAPAVPERLRARLLHYLFLGGGCTEKSLLHESFGVLQAPEQFFWMAQEHYRAGNPAVGIEMELRYAVFARKRGGYPEVCCGALGEDFVDDEWAGSLTPAECRRLLEIAVPLTESGDPALVQALAPFFVTGGIDLLWQAGRLPEIIAVIDRLDRHKPDHDCEARNNILGLRREKRAALAALGGNARP